MTSFDRLATGWVAALVIALTLAVSGCADEEDDSSGPDSVNGWTQGGGCGAWAIDGSAPSSGSLAPAEWADCIPALLPDEAYRPELETILSAYLGQYVDDDGNPKVLSCRPEGHWELPAEVPDNAACTTAWSIPVFVSYDATAESAEGTILQDSGSGPEFPVNMDRDAAVSFTDDAGIDYSVNKISRYGEGPTQWMIEVPHELWGVLWTKVE